MIAIIIVFLEFDIKTYIYREFNRYRFSSLVNISLQKMLVYILIA